MKLTHDGLSLWCGTPDAPAPHDDEVVSRSGVSIVIAVHPPNPTNAVLIRYRVDEGVLKTVPGREVRLDTQNNVQYFAATFPTFPTGNVVQYTPVLSCGGRQVPAPAMVDRVSSRFHLGTEEAAGMATQEAPPSETRGARFTPQVDFLASVTIRMDKPVYIGETPEGVRMDFFALDGTLIGPKLRGRVLSRSSDHLFVRPDGIGVIRVRAMVVTDDGAMLEVEYKGSVELGADGYARAIANNLPSRAPLAICPRVLTGHPKYLWLNRAQYFGVGEALVDELLLRYDCFSVCTSAVPSKR